MNFLKKHKILITNVSLILVVLCSVLYVKSIYNESQRNLSDISWYSKWLLNNESDISFNNYEWEPLELYINWELFHKWNTVNSFNEKITDLLDKNSKKKIYVNIYNWDELVKTEIFKYSDFWYLINTKWIVTNIKTGFISSKSKVEINLKDYLFFDNKLLNKKIELIKESFTENSNWEIYFSKDNKSFKVNSNKVYLSSVKDIKLNIAKVDQNVDLRDSAIDIYLVQEENVYFDQVEKLNEIIKDIELKQFTIESSLEWLDYNKVKNSIYALDIDKLTIQKEWNNFKLSFPKWFLSDYVSYNKELNFIEFNEENFDSDFWKLSQINLVNKPDEITEKPSLYSISQGWISENKPNEINFKILSYWNWFSFDYIGLKKEFKLFINKTISTNIDEIEIDLNNLFVKNTDETRKELLVTNFDNTYISKDKYNLDKWLFQDWDYITEKYINYWNYPFKFKEDVSAYNSCSIKNNIELICENWEMFMWKLGYNSNKIILKEPDSTLYQFANESDYGTLKKNWNLVFVRDNVSIYYWKLYNNVKLNNLSEKIIQDYKTELFPRFMWDNIEWSIVYDKVVFKFKKNSNSNSLLIKTDSELENNYVYLFNIDFKEDE